MNYSTSAAGGIRVEILDDAGAVHQGRSKNECIEAIGNYIDGKIKWKEHENLNELAGKSIRLRIFLKDANLYSFYIK